MLKDGGRAVIADIVSDREVPPSLKTHPDLWSECTVGALTDEAFVAALEKAGFFGPVIDEEGHTFPRGVMVEVCTDTALKLRTPPYAGAFAVLEPGETATDVQFSSCCPGGSC